MIEKNTLLKALGEGIVIVTFTKKDGTERVMECTRSPQLIPLEHAPKGETQEVTEATDNIRVFDIQAQGWRSFNYTSLKG